jgi:hypothetical protein
MIRFSDAASDCAATALVRKHQRPHNRIRHFYRSDLVPLGSARVVPARQTLQGRLAMGCNDRVSMCPGAPRCHSSHGYTISTVVDGMPPDAQHPVGNVPPCHSSPGYTNSTVVHGMPQRAFPTGPSVSPTLQNAQRTGGIVAFTGARLTTVRWNLPTAVPWPIA